MSSKDKASFYTKREGEGVNMEIPDEARKAISQAIRLLKNDGYDEKRHAMSVAFETESELSIQRNYDEDELFVMRQKDLQRKKAVKDYVKDPSFSKEGMDQIKYTHRSTVVDWMAGLVAKRKGDYSCFFLAVECFDRFMSKRTQVKENLELLALACLWIAIKHEECKSHNRGRKPHPNALEMIERASSMIDSNELILAERDALNVLGYRLAEITVEDFVVYYLSKVLEECSVEESFTEEDSDKLSASCRFVLSACMLDLSLVSVGRELLVACSMVVGMHVCSMPTDKALRASLSWDVLIEAHGTPSAREADATKVMRSVSTIFEKVYKANGEAEIHSLFANRGRKWSEVSTLYSFKNKSSQLSTSGFAKQDSWDRAKEQRSPRTAVEKQQSRPKKNVSSERTVQGSAKAPEIRLLGVDKTTKGVCFLSDLRELKARERDAIGRSPLDILRNNKAMGARESGGGSERAGRAYASEVENEEEDEESEMEELEEFKEATEGEDLVLHDYEEGFDSYIKRLKRRGIFPERIEVPPFKSHKNNTNTSSRKSGTNSSKHTESGSKTNSVKGNKTPTTNTQKTNEAAVTVAPKRKYTRRVPFLKKPRSETGTKRKYVRREVKPSEDDQGEDVFNVLSSAKKARKTEDRSTEKVWSSGTTHETRNSPESTWRRRGRPKREEASKGKVPKKRRREWKSVGLVEEEAVFSIFPSSSKKSATM